MKKLKVLAVALAAVALTGSALAIPTLIISDGVTSTSLTSASGIVTYANGAFDGAWSVVISTAETKPAIGSAGSPVLDLNIQATSLPFSPLRNLSVTFFDTGFGPSPSQLQSILSGHVVTGTGANVTYNTYVSALNTGATTTLVTGSGNLAPPTYAFTGSGGVGSLNPYSITQVVTIGGAASSGAGGSYSLDASVSGVPDGGTTVMLLGAALSGLALIRRKIA